MREPIFKGATRPAMKWGVPLVALVGLFMPGAAVAVWSVAIFSPLVALGIVLVLVPLYGWMRLVTARDDQRLLQVVLAARLSMASRYAGSFRARTYAALRGRGHRDAWR